MTIHDFELTARVRARRLVAHVPAAGQTVGEDVDLCGEEVRSALPAILEPDTPYDDIAVEKRVTGSTTAGGRRAEP